MKNQEKKDFAKLLFIQSNLNRKEIASQVGVTEKTLRNWIESDNWQDIKDSQTITREALLSDSYAQLKAINEKIKTELGGVPNKELSDAKAVIRKEIESLSVHPTYRYVEVMEEFQSWLTRNEPQHLKVMTELSLKFVEEIAAKRR